MTKTPLEPRISVVIPTFNRVRQLGHCLEALAKQDLDHSLFEVLVIDDGSTDGTVEFLSSLEEKSPLELRSARQDHAGPATARNVGLRESRADLVAFTDDDCIADSDWLATLVRSMPDDPECAGLGGPIRGVRDSMVGRFIDHSRLMSHSTPEGRAEYLITANAVFRTELVREIGGFDAAFPLAGGEDADLCFRLRRQGHYLLAMAENGFIRHHHHDTWRGFFRMCWRHGYGARQLGYLGLADQPRCTVRMAAGQIGRAVLAKPIPGADGATERLAWWALEVLHRTAKCAGNRAWKRHEPSAPVG